MVQLVLSVPFVRLKIRHQRKIKINGDGSNVRCFLSVYDFIDAILLLIKKKTNGIYNVGNHHEYHNLEVAKLICNLLGKNIKKEIKFVKDRPFNDKRYSINTEKIKRIGWRPKKNLINDLPFIISWYKKNLKLFNL